MRTIRAYLLPLLDEKGIDLETPINVVSKNGTPNCMTLQNIVDRILAAPFSVQKKIHLALVRIDFQNGDVLVLFRDLAKLMAIDLPTAASRI